MFRVVLVDQLREPQGTSHPGGPTADDDHIGRHLRPFDAFESFSKYQHKNQPRICADSHG
jgi:hypothetical protein